MSTDYNCNDRQYLLSNSVNSLSSSDADHAKPIYYHHLKTIHLALLHLFASLAIFITAAILEIKWMTDYSCRTYFVILYIRCAYWLFTFVLDSVIGRRHQEVRQYGYHTFYNTTILGYKNAPLNIVSLWNTTILLIQTLMQHSYGMEFPLHCQKSVTSPITYICMFCGLETILLTFVHGSYIMRVWRFNRSRYLPDALRDSEQPFIGSLGITVQNSKVAELLEKQADLIHYLRELNFNLNKKLMQLNDQMKLMSNSR